VPAKNRNKGGGEYRASSTESGKKVLNWDLGKKKRKRSPIIAKNSIPVTKLRRTNDFP